MPLLIMLRHLRVSVSRELLDVGLAVESPLFVEQEPSARISWKVGRCSLETPLKHSHLSRIFRNSAVKVLGG